MRRMRFLLIGLLVLLSMLSGCAVKEPVPADDQIIIAVDISEIKDPVYRLDIEYFLDDELMGGLAVSHADTSRFKGPAYFGFIPENFPEEALLDNFSFQITVCGDKNGINDLFSSSEIIATTERSKQFPVKYGNLYHYKITGSFEKGFTLTAE